ncbi:uncharacterized protein [Tenebrio molitor]|jgi:hypothetical protein|uniref:uncharacterized protein isoform X1 n=1 Tax=Tenebrio molitor TaxID=7067 RepID=UPI001C3B4EF0|nr:unnamed protein product [Tenebrio molitor]
MEPHFLSRYKYLLICVIPNIMILFGYYDNYIKDENGIILFKKVDGAESAYTDLTKYLVDTKNCRIPDIDPLNSDVWPYYKKQDYVHCRNLDLLTYVDRVDDYIFLKINYSVIDAYSAYPVSCCYSNVTRGKGSDADDTISFSECEFFEDSTEVTSDLIKVTCGTEYGEVYSNVHGIVRENEETKIKREADKDYSVLLIGIDTMSQLNLMRTMPKTYRFLEKNNWVNLRGYNKIDDNTFPNLMAILSGMNLSQVHTICNPEKNFLDSCDIIWNRFRQFDYVTSYAEDESQLNTFSYLMKGFNNTPTDFYFRPYFLAAETLTVVTQYLASYCTGPETSGERILGLIKDFCEVFVDKLKFGLFWMNTFSHNNINTASGMDDVFEDFLEDVMTSRASDNTIIVFFSDHGFRFGKIRYTYSGWLEERLPFIYIWVPKSFRNRYPESYNNLKLNSERLTTPYDLYMTLQDILYRSDNSYKIQPSLACPKCKSLFQRIDEDRSCDDAAISQHLCTCMGHFYIDPNSRIVKKATYFALDKLRSTVNSFFDGPRMCATYDLKHIISSGITETFYNKKHESVNYLLIVFETFPKAVFEATVSISYQNFIPLFTLQGIISRVDRYGNTSACVTDPILRKYCHCDGFYTKIKKTVDILFNN